MITNPEYQSIIDKINKIRSHGLNKMLTIPQIAIVGDQSSGKSSVLEALTQLSFPRDIDTCTRFATQVNLRQSEKSEMSARIEGESNFNERFQPQASGWDIFTIITEANYILCPGASISEKILEITIAGPSVSPLTLIDLPGYINTTVDGQDKTIVQTIRTINTQYIQDSRTIILAVVPANVDLNNIFALGEAERYDPENIRTIPIVTNPDTIETDMLPSLIKTLLNKRKHMRLGYLVMKNSSFKDIDLSWDDARKREEEFFRSSPLWNDVPDTRKGRLQVKDFLGDLLYRHIKKELPVLETDIKALIAQYEKDLADMGTSVSTNETATSTYFSHILRLQSSLADLLNGNYAVDYIKTYLSRQRSEDVEESGDSDDDDCEPIILEEDGDHNFIRSSLYKLYQHYNTAMNKDKYLLPNDKITELVLLYKGNELSGFISFTTFTQIYTDTLLRWSSITKNHIANMHQFLHRAISTFISSAAHPGIRDALCLEFDRFYNSQVEQIDGAIENIFASEIIPFTMNKYYYDNILNSRKTKAEQHIQEVVNKFQLGNNSNFSGHQVKDILQRSLTSYCNVQHLSDADYNERLAIEDLQEQLISYCKVARKRIVDVILLQTIELHMIKQTDIYFDHLKSCDSSNRISRLLLDSPSKIKRRQELEDRVAVLRKSLKELWSSDTTRT